MFAFSVAIGSEETYIRYAAPGLRRVLEADSMLVERRGEASIFSAYNGVLDGLRGRSDLEGLVLLHEDTELRDDHFLTKIRRRLADPSVAVIGAIGASGVRSIAWWQGRGIGSISETRGTVDFGRADGSDVDAVDGLLLIMSPWAVDNLRFDEALPSGFHGYDVDICFQARARGRRVIVENFDLFHHTKGGYGDRRRWLAANRAWHSKWRPDAPLSERLRWAARDVRALMRPARRERLKGAAIKLPHDRRS